MIVLFLRWCVNNQIRKIIQSDVLNSAVNAEVDLFREENIGFKKSLFHLAFSQFTSSLNAH